MKERIYNELSTLTPGDRCSLPGQGATVMSLQPMQIFGLVLAALIFAVTAFIYRRKGMGTKKWYVTIASFLFILLAYILLGVIGFFTLETMTFASIVVAIIGLVTALWWRPRTG